MSYNVAVQHCLEDFGFQHADLQFEGSAVLVVGFLEYASGSCTRLFVRPIDFNRQVGVFIDAPAKVYDIMCPFFVHLVIRLDVERRWANTLSQS